MNELYHTRLTRHEIKTMARSNDGIDLLRKIIRIQADNPTRTPAFYTIYNMWKYKSIPRGIFNEKFFNMEGIKERTQGRRQVIISLENAAFMNEKGEIEADIGTGKQILPKSAKLGDNNVFLEKEIADEFFKRKITFKDDVALLPPCEKKQKYPLYPPFNCDLLPAQERIVRGMLSQRKAFLHGDTGTGKTIMSLAYMASLKACGVINKILVLAPAATVANWKNKNKQYYGDNKIEVRSIEITRTTYEDIIEEMGNGYGLIIDESHRVGNQSQQSRTCRQIALYASAICLMTATPLTRNFTSFIRQVLMLNVLPINSVLDFEKQYCLMGTYKTQEGLLGKYISAYIGLNELLNTLNPYFSRIEKKDVGLNIPIIKKNIEIEIEGERKIALSDARDAVSRANGDKVLFKAMQRFDKISAGFDFEFNELDRLIVKPGFRSIPAKEKALAEIIAKEKAPVIVWYHFDAEGKRIKRLHENGVILSGKQTHKEKAQIVSDFEKGKIPILIANIGIGIGIDLVASNVAIYYNSTFSFVEKKQSLDRIHRIGQKAKEIRVYEIIPAGSIADWHNSVVELKQRMTTDIMGINYEE